ncbi:MAG TPA: GvpL/GvpF family gas vesicle protein [Pyrinomonadaceae bacterium]|nr:GvpL/GvpF family gas vesicle protein [Pyrinomonadaceae bacterium]
MTRRAPKHSVAEESGDPEPPGAAFYVYCIGEREQLSALFGEESLPASVEDAATLELVEAGHLAAVVSAVPLSDYGEGAIEQRLADPAWTAARALRHQQAVEFFARVSDIVPLRFGTIYLTRARVRKMLEENGEALRTVVERLRGREEWGVNVHADRAVLKEKIVEASERLREMSRQAEAAAPGQAYLLRKKIETLRADESRAEMKRVALEVESELGAAAEGSARLRVFKDESSEGGDAVAAKLAFLVARERFEEFRATAERIAARNARHGFRFELTGPWPAYNFATVEKSDD